MKGWDRKARGRAGKAYSVGRCATFDLTDAARTHVRIVNDSITSNDSVVLLVVETSSMKVQSITSLQSE